MSIPAASLVIPSRDRPTLLLAAVSAVLNGKTLPAEIVIVDQSMAPHPTLSALSGGDTCSVRYLSTRSVGVSRARNVGVAAARHDVLAFIDDDVLVTPSWFQDITLALIEAGPRSIVTGQVMPTQAEFPGGFAPSLKVDSRRMEYAGRIDLDVLYSNNMALPRAAFDVAGGFDERLGPGSHFSNAEDNDLGFRLLDAGYRIIYVPEAVVYHRAWRTQRDYPGLMWSYGRGQGAYFAKHLSVRDRYMLRRLTVHTLRHIVRAAELLRRRRRSPAFGELVYVLGIMSGTAEWLLTQTALRRDMTAGT